MSAPRREPHQFPEALALFNPPLGAYLIWQAVHEYSTRASQPMPFTSAFLILPFSLHPPIRASLPRSARTSLTSWALGSSFLQSEFGRVAAVLMPVSRRSLRFALRGQMLTIDSGSLRALGRIRSVPRDFPEEITESVRAAKLCGRWMASVDPVTMYSVLGVRP